MEIRTISFSDTICERGSKNSAPGSLMRFLAELDHQFLELVGFFFIPKGGDPGCAGGWEEGLTWEGSDPGRWGAGVGAGLGTARSRGGRRGEGEGWSSQLCAPNPPGTFGRDELFCLCKSLPFLWWLAFCGCILSYSSTLCTHTNVPKMSMGICNTKLKSMNNLISSLGCEFNDSKTFKLHINSCILWKKAIADFSLFFLPPQGEFYSRTEQINLVRFLGVQSILSSATA